MNNLNTNKGALENMDKDNPFYRSMEITDPKKATDFDYELKALSPPDIPSSVLPGYLGEFSKAVSESLLVPETAVVLQILSVLATCLQKKFIVHVKNDHKETLSLWTFVALDSGARKSGVITDCKGPISEWEHAKSIEMRQEIADSITERNVSLKRIEVLELRAGKEDDDVERLIIKNEISEYREKMPTVKEAPNLWTGDVTPETLQDLMVAHNERMSLLSDEGGIFKIMGGLYSGGKANIDVFLQGYTGTPVRVHRKTRKVDLKNPAISFGLIVQPAVLEDFGGSGHGSFKDIGVMGRFLYGIPNSIIGTRILTDAKKIPDEIKKAYYKKIKDLLDIKDIQDDDGANKPRILKLSPEALEIWEKFAQNIEFNEGDGGDLFEIQTWSAKLAGNSARIAGLIHVAIGHKEDQLISEETMDAAVELCELLIPHAQAAYNKTGPSADMRDAGAVYDWILKLDKMEFSRRECHHKFQGRFKTVGDRMLNALALLQRYQVITPYKKSETGGRPSEMHNLTPSFIKMKEDRKRKIAYKSKTKNPE